MAILSSEGIEAPKFKATAPPIKNVAQIVYVESSTKVPDSIGIPSDNTPPQITEGTVGLSASFTPINPNSTLVIEYVGVVGAAAANDITVALFRSGASNAIHLVSGTVPAAQYTQTFKIRKVIKLVDDPGARTYSIRFGANSVASSFNGYNQLNVASMTITEYLP